MSRAAAVIILIGIILLGLWWFTTYKKAVGESPFHEAPEGYEPGSPPPENLTTTTTPLPEETTTPEPELPTETPTTTYTQTTTLPPPVTGKFIVELLDSNGKVLTTKQSILYTITGVTYPKVDKIRFRIEGVNPTRVSIYMTVYKIGDVPTTTTTTSTHTYISPSPEETTTTPITYITTTTTPIYEEPSPEEPEPLPTVTTTTTTTSSPGGPPEEPIIGGPGFYYPLSIIVDCALIYDGAQTEVVLPYTVLPYHKPGIHEVYFWAWVWVPGTSQQLVSEYVTFKVMVYSYKVYWVGD